MDEDHYFLKRTHNKDPNFFSFLFLIVAEVLTNSHYNLFYCKRWGRGDDDSFDKEYIFLQVDFERKIYCVCHSKYTIKRKERVQLGFSYLLFFRQGNMKRKGTELMNQSFSSDNHTLTQENDTQDFNSFENKHYFFICNFIFS